ncbi:MAG: 3-hydroxyacyl-ACP dehydratase [Campylobacterales bacterium]|nr:3-hydroxyacyl-ACP dehydratase [Campylobacterales bacterium]
MKSLYSILHSKISEEFIEYEIQLTDKNHPIFQAHFPNNHLLPGFLHIDIASELLNKELIKINKAKFLQPILPLDKILFIIEKKKENYKVIIKKENKKCSEFTFVTK